ncbi:hypothetical protein BDN70DRAFT_888818 [Pholiota conissans]|uniref:Uncharacterized protein n=1 Tax=Pholiota conissans TaxID=109636 RepID=A0A9P5YLE6_9AGAR|nr:hypothetical protein BDN70DRAFT_888818 [Pholiota conissans]
MNQRTENECEDFRVEQRGTTYLINGHPKRPRYGYVFQASPKPFRARNESHTLEVLLTPIIYQWVHLMSRVEQSNTYTFNIDA